MFASISRSRDTKEGNHRTVLDKVLLEYLIGRDSIIKGWQQRGAVLNMLEPRDRMRMLGLVRRPASRSDAIRALPCACSAWCAQLGFLRLFFRPTWLQVLGRVCCPL